MTLREGISLTQCSPEPPSWLHAFTITSVALTTCLPSHRLTSCQQDALPGRSRRDGTVHRQIRILEACSLSCKCCSAWLCSPASL